MKRVVEPATGINDINSSTTNIMDVYNLSGQLILKSVPYNIIHHILPSGVYVVNKQKVVIK